MASGPSPGPQGQRECRADGADRMKMPALAELAAALALAIFPLAGAARPAPPAARDDAADGRIEDLVRVWYFARLFHPDLAGSTDAWDAALVAAVPAASVAPDEAAFA